MVSMDMTRSVLMPVFCRFVPDLMSRADTGRFCAVVADSDPAARNAFAAESGLRKQAYPRDFAAVADSDPEVQNASAAESGLRKQVYRPSCAVVADSVPEQRNASAAENGPDEQRLIYNNSKQMSRFDFQVLID